MAILILLVATGVVSHQLTAAVIALVTAAVPVEIFRGVVRLLRERGVTVQAVAGALAIYLSIGLVFAWIISFISHVDSAPYFAQHTSGTEGDKVYFSFTVLTTTGFGDFPPQLPSATRLRSSRCSPGSSISSRSSGCWSAASSPDAARLPATAGSPDTVARLRNSADDGRAAGA